MADTSALAAGTGVGAKWRAILRNRYRPASAPRRSAEGLHIGLPDRRRRIDSSSLPGSPNATCRSNRPGSFPVRRKRSKAPTKRHKVLKLICQFCAFFGSFLLESFSSMKTPWPAVGRSDDSNQSCSRAVFRTRRIRSRLDLVADMERIFIDALLRKLAGGGAFDGPLLSFSRLHIEEGVRSEEH